MNHLFWVTLFSLLSTIHAFAEGECTPEQLQSSMQDESFRDLQEKRNVINFVNCSPVKNKDQNACENSVNYIKKNFIPSYETRIRGVYCQTSIAIVKPGDGCYQDTSCAQEASRKLEYAIKQNNSIIKILGSHQTELKKLIQKNIAQAESLMKSYDGSNPTKTLSANDKKFIDTEIRNINNSLRQTTFSAGKDPKAKTPESTIKTTAPDVNAELSAASALLAYYSASKNLALSKNQNNTNIAQQKQELDRDINNDGNGQNPTGSDSGTSSGFDMDTALKAAQAGMGLAQAFMQNGSTSDISTSKTPDVISLNSKNASSQPSNKIDEPNNTKSSGGSESGGSNFASLGSSESKNKSGITNPNLSGASMGKFEAAGGSGGGGAALGSSATNTKNQNDSKTPNKSEEESLSSFGGSGSLRYNGGNSSGSEGGEANSPMADMLTGMEENLDNQLDDDEARDLASQGEDQNFDSQLDPENPSLFTRHRSCIERCLKRGCALNGLGEKLK